MDDAAYRTAIVALYDAVIDEQHRQEALQTAARFLGVAGAGIIVVEKYSDRPCLCDWCGPVTLSPTEYQEHFSRIDPYRSIRQNGPTKSWMQLSEIFSPQFLSGSEWYTDFLSKGGVRDILGGKLYESASHIFLYGLYRLTGERGGFSDCLPALDALREPLYKAAGLQAGLLDTGYQSAIARGAVEILPTGVVFADQDGRVLWMNPAAELIARRNDGLTVSGGRLSAQTIADVAKLEALIATAIASPPIAGCIRVRRTGNSTPYIVRAAPLGVALEMFDRPVAFVLISTPDDLLASEADVSAIFGLSPAESRLALALTRGQRPDEFARQNHVKMPTVRTQLSAILRKLGIKRQSDIVRLILSVPAHARAESNPSSVQISRHD
jgi:DNA-binding CsgD family transcriptional regulator